MPDLLSSWQCLLAVDEESTPGSESLITDAVLDLMVGAMIGFGNDGAAHRCPGSAGGTGSAVSGERGKVSPMDGQCRGLPI